MTTAMPSGETSPREATFGALASSWPLLVGAAAVATPTLLILAANNWSREDGAHGPLILATAAWLLWLQWPAIRKEGVPGQGWLVGLLLGFALLFYVTGQAFDLITLSAAGLYGVGFAIFYSKFGARAIIRNWFIFFYLLFAVPPPRMWLDRLTFPLKQFVSTAATEILQPLGIPVAHEGVVIYVAQYQLLVEDACSGMNSIFGLLAISLFYIYLMRGGSWWYSLILGVLSVPIAILANIIRIVILILLTYYAGDDVAQGFLHMVAGVFVFATALILMFVVDTVLSRILPISGRRTA
jgi:exosortase